MQKTTTRRMLAILGIGTILVVTLLFLAYHFVIGPKGLKTNFPTLSTIAQGASKDCVECHEKENPGIVQQYHDSKHSGRGVQCLDCHKPVAGQETMTKEHYKVAMVAKPTPNNCVLCHEDAVKQSAESNHAARSWYSVEGAKNFTTEELAKHHLLGADGKPINAGSENPIFNLIGKDASVQSCEVCHAIGQKNQDGSFGDCTKCHLRHTFDVAQARQPETCGQCHLGPDHPQIEVYTESAHGAYYNANKDKFNLEAPSGTLTVKDFPAPTCATCHMSAFGSVTGSHNVGERLKWKLQPEIAVVRENGDKNRETMNTICLNCHTTVFIKEEQTKADKTINVTNENVLAGRTLVADIRKAGLIGEVGTPGIKPLPMSTPVDFLYFELWHHEGRRARNGAVMGGPDYVNWHGIYEQKKALVELKAKADELKAKQ